MSIVLKIISYQRLTPGQQDSFHFENGKFSIGRGSDNDWTLPDPQRFMSGTHCNFENHRGSWFITDTSTNGVFVNGADERLTRNEAVPLNSGDQIRLGDYELEAVLDADELSLDGLADTTPGGSLLAIDEHLPNDVPNVPTQDSTAGADLKQVNTPLSQMDSGLLGDSVSIDELFGLDDEDEEPESPPSLASQGNQGSSLRQHFAAPKVQQQDAAPDPYEFDLDSIPDNWDEDTGLIKKVEKVEAAGPAPVAPVQTPVKPARKSTAGSPLTAFAEGAGLDLTQLKVVDEDAFFHELGSLLNTMTEGLMQAISSRGQIKSEFRLEQTMIAPVENNPFKFSTSAQEAMIRMFNRADKAYLAGPLAAAEAIDDINAHQLAVMAGTEAALRSILRRFSPETLETRFNNGSMLGKVLPLFRKARCWNLYQIMFNEISEAADEDFQQMFGTEFSNAYEKQLDRLKIARKDTSK